MTASEEMMADVQRVDYDIRSRIGRVWMGGLSCTDMTGAIRFFQRIDPNVRRIVTVNEDGLDTVYFCVGGEWQARSRS